ncbi:ATP-dependent DNA helicase PIF1 [Elysia marginata]|uniref:ATP-dependent DNA helicase n=1 Tax=Elysia marginata TaxID=1093978 RepID=A0AAV4FEF9_9GAST|nr:ATP-dependent DNA helicase PIF1 [Elysia marginata]
MDSLMRSIKQGTSLSHLIQDASVLVIDEAPMLHKKIIEALDRTLHGLRETDEVMGGLPTLMCGDFKQIMPVVLNGTKADAVDAGLKKSLLWSSVTMHRLRTNMRVTLHGDFEDKRFSEMLLQIGDRKVPIITVRHHLNAG